MVGTEHLVELSEQRGRFLKITKPPAFGLTPYINLIETVAADPTVELPPRPSLEFRGASPIDYLTRWRASNELFGDDVRLASVVRWKEGQVSFVVTQPQYHGVPAGYREIERYFLEAGWERLREPDGHLVFFNFALGVIAVDAAPRNCYLNEGGLQPFDVILCEPDEALAAFLGIRSSRNRRLRRWAVWPEVAAVIRTLRAVDFRCFEALSLELPAAGGVFTGANAQGKTSILEAVCLLVRVHSPRTHRISTVARVGGAGGFGIAGEAWGVERRVRWERGKAMDFAVEGEGRTSQSDYLADGGLLVWMGNEDLELVRGGGEVRRRYFDFIGAQFDPHYRRALARYRRALKAKNLLLKDHRPREAEIASWESIMVEAAALLVRVRAELVRLLSPSAAGFQRKIAGRDEALELEYRPAGGTGLPAALEQARDKERAQRQSLVGPHRDDVMLRINSLKAGDFASEGQQRTLALALKLAQGEVLAACRGSQPVWLIDDIFGELDVARRNAVLAALPADAQKWVTTTHLDWLDETAGLGGIARFEVEDGAARLLG